jgi:LAS superfamily LD-carboxypeptidase LdcB
MTNIDTKYGVIHLSDPGPFKAYDNVNVYRQNKTGTRYVQLQGPALRAFKAAEARVATRRRPHILITGHGYRDYQTQRELYASDPGRFADPDHSMHVEALAIDVDQGQGTLRLNAIRKALEAEHWHYGVSGEPWHASYHVVG